MSSLSSQAGSVFDPFEPFEPLEPRTSLEEASEVLEMQPDHQPDPESEVHTDPECEAADSGSAGSEGVSEVAVFIAKLIPALPYQTVEDLTRLLRRRLTTVDRHQVRYVRLGLLMDLVSLETAELPSTRQYDEERARRAQLGESDWPAHSTLITAYGGWVRAVEAALLLRQDGSASKVPISHHHKEDPAAPYSYDEAASALVACYEQAGQWPDEWEYDEWRRLSRDLARNAGLAMPRYPGRETWLRMYRSWEAFKAAALRRIDDGQSDAGPELADPQSDAGPELADPQSDAGPELASDPQSDIDALAA